MKVSPRGLAAALRRIEKEILTNGDRAVRDTARLAVKPIRKRVPVAFGTLRDSVHPDYSDGIRTVVDAPHAEAVEIGSAPHMPDIEALIKWVKLRGMQGITPGRKAGPTSLKQSRRVAALIRKERIGKGQGSFTPIDAAEKVARAIARGIEQHGTKPHWFVRESIDDIEVILATQMKKRTG